MIEAAVCVCGAQEYFNMAEISIPSFMLANEGTKLTVFSTEPERLLHLQDEYHPLVIKDYETSADNLPDKYKSYYDYVKERSNEGWENDGVFHEHHYIACFPVLAQAYANPNSVFTLKFDVDSFWVGDVLIDVIEDIMFEYHREHRTRDLYLVQRPDNGINKPFGNCWPGVGFLLWLNKGLFLERYCSMFNGNEQETVLVELAHKKAVSYRSFGEFTWHVVYPYWYAKKSGREFDLTQISTPFHLHIHGDDDSIGHNRMEIMEKLWEEFYG